ncbi:HIT domain-containing protein [Amorphus orientalis]|uniref:Diadenosine tetraphosphate (Ap4A) HIT family hydrolase n=1 Tax=Amorphus orientalis TaxID=649198 RepID=A0AAE3VN84_9HYPH|nr:HIT family protein [Amorphus orientalis]MDQ0315214.1 diadenosine tetraphosphate (Ap4A) HIT family hydrolase [Amorphus orientalis]
MAHAFALDERLAADTMEVTELELCTVRLMNDRTYPWLILVPRRADCVELIDLDPGDRAVLMEEIALVSRILRQETDAEKLNVAALGNAVPQLHIHVIARFADDPAWPGPVWGKTQPLPWDGLESADFTARLDKALQES